MPSFSGLWDGVHGDGYAAMPKADAMPPQSRGIIRTFMQRPSMFGHVKALGRNALSDWATIDADRGDITVPGTFTWPARTLARDVTVTNSASHSDGSIVDGFLNAPPQAQEGELANTYDTTLRNGHPADVADSGVTSPAVTAQVG